MSFLLILCKALLNILLSLYIIVTSQLLFLNDCMLFCHFDNNNLNNSTNIDIKILLNSVLICTYACIYMHIDFLSCNKQLYTYIAFASI